MKSIVGALLIGFSLAWVTAVKAADVSKLDQRIEAAHDVLHELMATPDKGIPLDDAGQTKYPPFAPSFRFTGGCFVPHLLSRISERHSVASGEQ
jgi:SH3 domain-containing YSC84-like protein 1